MIFVHLDVTCEHQGCTVGTTGRMRLDGFIHTYSDGSYYAVPDLCMPQLPDGWISRETRVLVAEGTAQRMHSWCPQHASEAGRG